MTGATGGWAFPTPEGREHYYQNGRSLCGKTAPPDLVVIDSRFDESEDPCVTCDRIATREMAATWCEHSDPRAECPDCAEAVVEAAGLLVVDPVSAREDIARALAGAIHDAWCDGVCGGVWNPETRRFDGCGEDDLYDRLDDVGAQADAVLAALAVPATDPTQGDPDVAPQWCYCAEVEPEDIAGPEPHICSACGNTIKPTGAGV